MLKELEDLIATHEQHGVSRRAHLEEEIAALKRLESRVEELYGPMLHSSANVPEVRARGRAELDKMAAIYERMAAAYASLARTHRDFAGE